ncbi:MAG: AMP-binding protein, partial [Gammaproteobacteria bacterium]|nr:AMP-binding protein [Gammaproteobacteria bacterium]
MSHIVHKDSLRESISSLYADGFILRTIDGSKLLVTNIKNRKLSDKQRDFIKQHKRVLLDLILKANTPASAEQTRFYFAQEFLEQDAYIYNMPVAFNLRGTLSLTQLNTAFNSIIARHASLRTYFYSQDDLLHQKVKSQLNLSVKLIVADSEKRDEKLLELATENYILHSLPLIRMYVIKHSQQDTTLLINMHHIIGDGRSLAIFLNELFSVYKALSQGEAIALPEIKYQYADFCRWQKAWLNSSTDFQQQMTFWQKKLLACEPLTLIGDVKVQNQQLHQGGRRRIKLPDSVRSQALDLCRELKVSEFGLFSAILNVLLFRYTGINDITLGTVVDNRPNEEFDNVLGCFVNTLVLRNQISATETVASIIKSVQHNLWEAFDNRLVPFDTLVNQFNITRSIDKQPFFQIMMVYQQATLESAFNIKGLDISECSFEYGTAKFDMTWNFIEDKSSFFLEIEYRLGKYSDKFIARMLTHWVNLLENICHNPQSLLADLSFLSAQELKQLLPAKPVVSETNNKNTVIDIFYKNVALYPQNIAVIDEAQKLSYETLNNKSNGLAQCLIDSAVMPGDYVGIVLDRQADLIIAILATLKIGAAYVPLDSNSPKLRLTHIIEDACLGCIITVSTYEHITSKLGIKIIDINEENTAGKNSQNINNILSPLTIAYIIY